MKQPLDGFPELMTPGEARTALGYADDKSVRQLATRGRIRSCRIPGGHHRYWATDVRALVRAGIEQGRWAP